MNTLWFCLLPCKWQHNSDVNSTEQQRGPVVYWCEQRMSYSWAWSKAKECDHKLRLLLYFVLIGFSSSSFFFGLHYIPMWWLSEQFFFPKQARTRTHWLRWPCAVKEPASWGMGSAVCAQGGWGVPGLGCAPSTPREAVSPEWRRHHRTTPFNLKSAGFKALCWQ